MRPIQFGPVWGGCTAISYGARGDNWVHVCHIRPKSRPFRAPTDRYPFAVGNDEPQDGDFEDEERPLGAPLPPDDRLWRHPSEMSLQRVSAQTGVRTRGHHKLLWAVTVGAAAVVVASLAFQNLALSHDASPASTDSSTNPSSSYVAVDSQLVRQALRSVRGSIVGVTVISSRGPLRRGSGVVVDPNGLILSSSVLVGRSSDAAVALPDGRVIEGKVVGRDRAVGLALISVPVAGLRPALLDPTITATPGELVMCVAAPGSGGGAPKVTVGTVDAVGEPMAIKHSTLVGTVQADIPFGASALGGLLVNRSGKVIGVNLWISRGVAHSVDAAAPAALAAWDAHQLEQAGIALHGWLGVAGRPAHTPQGTPGLRVTEVLPHSPAETAGVQVGDTIATAGGQPTPTMAALVQVVRLDPPGTRLAIRLIRDGRPITLTVTLSGRDA